jgi:hypothetical protein
VTGRGVEVGTRRDGDDNSESTAVEGSRGDAAEATVEAGMGGEAENYAPRKDATGVSSVSGPAGYGGVYGEGDAEPARCL